MLGPVYPEMLKAASLVDKAVNAEDEGFRQFYLCHQERRVQRFHEVLNDYVARP